MVRPFHTMLQSDKQPPLPGMGWYEHALVRTQASASMQHRRHVLRSSLIEIAGLTRCCRRAAHGAEGRLGCLTGCLRCLQSGLASRRKVHQKNVQTWLSGQRPCKLTRNAAVAKRWPEAVRSGGGEPGCAAEMIAVKTATTATFVMKTESREYVDIFFFTEKQ